MKERATTIGIEGEWNYLLPFVIPEPDCPSSPWCRLIFPKRGLVDQAFVRRSWNWLFQFAVSIRSRRTPEETYQSYARRPRRAGASSKYRGVSFRKQTQLWRAQVYWKGRRYFLGSFDTEREAALAYNIHAQRIIGELALLNDLSSDDAAVSGQG